MGEGALFRLLPSPKRGIEVREKTAGKGIRGVEYGTDVMRWSPPRSWEERDVVVVMNPPFNKQVDIMNRCAQMRCKSLRVVWIAGLAQAVRGCRWHLQEEQHRDDRVQGGLPQPRMGLGAEPVRGAVDHPVDARRGQPGSLQRVEGALRGVGRERAELALRGGVI